MTTTDLVVCTFVIGLGIYDGVVVWIKGKGSFIGESVSRCLQRTGLKSPLFIFMFGFIMGHLFGYMAPECPVDQPSQAEVQNANSK